MCISDLPANGLYFLVYEYIQDVAKSKSENGQINTASTIFAGGAAGMAYWVLGMPADVLKSRLQSGEKLLIYSFYTLAEEIIILVKSVQRNKADISDPMKYTYKYS